MTTVTPYSATSVPVASEVRGLPAPARRAFERRLATLVEVLVGEPMAGLDDALDVVASTIGRQPDKLWLAHAVLAARLPTDDEVQDLMVRARLGGTWAALAPEVAAVADDPQLRDVRVVRGVVTCDVHATAQSDFLSGIQRVVRETVGRWQAREIELLAWTKDLAAFRLLRDEERSRFGGGAVSVAERGSASVVVPWECTHLWVEVVTELERTARLQALAQYSQNEVAVLGYDSIPVTTSSTVAEGMTAHFSRSLAAVRRADRVAMISAAAAEEYAGVLAMGAGRRETGPRVAAVPLAVSAQRALDTDLEEARRGLVVDGMPMVLVVGSHEPRKNHLAVLHAAELLWREGLRFNLVFVGAGAWASSSYDQVVGGLAAIGRPVQSIRGLPDRLLWAAYRLAHVTLFPSLNEGFGLPVAESLATGTPVITSDFGSMRDIVAPDGTPLGGLLVDPRDDRSIVDALRTVLSDTDRYGRLVAETALHSMRTWDEYASELWAFLVDGTSPAS